MLTELRPPVASFHQCVFRALRTIVGQHPVGVMILSNAGSGATISRLHRLAYDEQMVAQTKVDVEFYGVPRQRAGVDGVQLAFPTSSVVAADVIEALVRRFPTLSNGCLENGWLHASCAANVDGCDFISDPTTPLSCGQTLLVMSADAGG